MTSRKLNVLVVEDSRSTREMLVNLLQSDPELSVVDAVGDGRITQPVGLCFAMAIAPSSSGL
jgi:chemotaxis response regulator CheB